MAGSLSNGAITRCYARDGSVTADFSVGGLAGLTYLGEGISNCYATCSVSGLHNLDGLVGTNLGTISNSYATGSVSGNEDVGGLVGHNDDGTVTTSFWDTQISGLALSDGGTGLLTVQMMMLNTFTDAGWDFVGESENRTEDIWTINEGVDYPRFKWENVPPVAVAGEDQTVFVKEDCLAEVVLDGSASFDADGDVVTFHWSCEIEGEKFSSWSGNGVIDLADFAVLAAKDTAGGTDNEFSALIVAWLSRFGGSAWDAVLDVGQVEADLSMELPLGVHVFTLMVNDGTVYSEPDEVVVTVLDETPPELLVMLRPQVLWPPNHQMALIEPNIVATDNCLGQVTVALKSIVMNEGDETDTFDPEFDASPGAGHTLNDIEVDAEGSIFLRGERQGSGQGRIYTLTWQATDAAGNVTEASATVTLPHDIAVN